MKKSALGAVGIAKKSIAGILATNLQVAVFLQATICHQSATGYDPQDLSTFLKTLQLWEAHFGINHRLKTHERKPFPPYPAQ